MIKSFSGQVVFCLAIPEPYLLRPTLAKTDYPSLYIFNMKYLVMCKIYTDVGGIK